VPVTAPLRACLVVSANGASSQAGAEFVFSGFELQPAGGKVAQHSTQSLRNIAMAGHAGSGKTTLIEALLERAGAVQKAGSVERGTTVCDFSEQEKRYRHSLDVSVCPLLHDNTCINLLDTPGYPDLLGRALAVLPAVETVAVVINAETGVETVTRRIMEMAEARRLCRLVIINRIDAEKARPMEVMEQVTAAFGQCCLPLNLPARNGEAVADCFFEPADVEPDFSTVEEAHTRITDQVVELDDALMELYLEQGQDITQEQLHDPFERALRRGHLVPVCFVSASTGAGIRQLLRVFSRLMPNPLEGNPATFLTDAGEAIRLNGADHDSPFIGHVFKITVDPYVGRLATFRVHQGTLRSGTQVYVGQGRKPIRLAHLYHMKGKELVETAQVNAGDFCTVAKVEDLRYNDVLHALREDHALSFSAIELPQPMHGVALEPGQRGHEKKLSDALHRLAAEDPSLHIDFHTRSNETVLHGQGELHLRLVLERMRDEFGLELTTRPPRIAYRETITHAAEGHNRHKKQTGGAGQFGEVFLRVEPLARGSGFEFVNQVVGGAIPGQFIPAVEKGVRQVLEEGAVAGYPMQDLRVTVCDGKHHPVDSKEVAFVAAGRKAFLDAVRKAGPAVLEPIAKVEVTAPAQHVGDITGHLAGLRGRIAGTETPSPDRVVIHAEAPLAELSDFQTSLKSITGGQGSFSLTLNHYEPAPPGVQRELEQQFRPNAGDD
jgi:elongation factor G